MLAEAQSSLATRAELSTTNSPCLSGLASLVLPCPLWQKSSIVKSYLFKIAGKREVKKEQSRQQFSVPTAHLFWFMWHKDGRKKPSILKYTAVSSKMSNGNAGWSQ